MRINLLTDAPKHNLALMQISAYHKARGDSITLNEPQQPCDISYGSWLFNRLYHSDYYGGPAVDPGIRLEGFPLRPDYDLYPNIDYSLGYTWSYCPRQCGFCSVPKQNNTKEHHSIWEFHDSKFKKICLLNNNTFTDPQWLDTFQEIWEAGLVVHDENGYDLRLLDDDKAEALKRTRFEKQIHFAWDLIEDEQDVIRGLAIARLYKLDAMVYVLIGYNTSRDQDLYRCQVINDFGFDPYPMPYNGGTKADRAFKRFICLRGYRKYKSLSDAWFHYGRPRPRRSLRPQ